MGPKGQVRFKVKKFGFVALVAILCLTGLANASGFGRFGGYNRGYGNRVGIGSGGYGCGQQVGIGSYYGSGYGYNQQVQVVGIPYYQPQVQVVQLQQAPQVQVVQAPPVVQLQQAPQVYASQDYCQQNVVGIGQQNYGYNTIFGQGYGQGYNSRFNFLRGHGHGNGHGGGPGHGGHGR